MARRTKRAQAGFLITLELVLIFTILGLGLLVGIVAIRNALFKYFLNRKSEQIWVYDSGTPALILGRAFDMDEHETPRLFYIDHQFTAGPAPVDPDPAWLGNNYRAVIGVRDDRFTSRHRIFYTWSNDCGLTDSTGTNPCNFGVNGSCGACIVEAGNELGDDLAVGVVSIDGTTSGGQTFSTRSKITQAGGIGYIYPLQDYGPSYGIGRDVDNGGIGFPGTLYRETLSECEVSDLRSVWTSQAVVGTEVPFSGPEPCEPLPPTGVTITAAKCPVGQDTTLGAACTSPADSRCESVGTCTTIPGRNCTTDTVCQISLQACADTGYPCTGAADCEGVCENNFSISCDTNADCGGGNQCIGDQGACTAYAAGTCDITPITCDCPFTDDADPFNDWVSTGANCCPPGAIETSPGQCSLAFVADTPLQVATPVVRSDGSGDNALSIFTAPFKVNLPLDTSDLSRVAPGVGEGAPPGPITGPYDPSAPVDYDVAPEGEEPPL